MRIPRWILDGLISAMGIAACGLDGVTGRVLQIDGNSYHIHTMEGKDLRVHVDQSSRMDKVSAGDQVHLYLSKDGHAAFIQKIGPNE